jgi:hypothetical protein
VSVDGTWARELIGEEEHEDLYGVGAAVCHVSVEEEGVAWSGLGLGVGVWGMGRCGGQTRGRGRVKGVGVGLRVKG